MYSLDAFVARMVPLVAVAVATTLGVHLQGCSSSDSTSSLTTNESDAREPEAIDQTSLALVRPRLVVGARGQPDYENNWQSALPNVDADINGFLDTMRPTDDIAFHFNLNWAKDALETTADSWGPETGAADSVDLLYLNSHGDAWGDRSVLVMRNEDAYAETSSMRLGDNGVRGLSVLALNACNMLAHADGNLAARWSTAFAGGLRLVLGAHHYLYDTPGGGKRFAEKLKSGRSFGDAWMDGLKEEYSSNAPAIANTGRNGDDCWARMGATAANVLSLPRLRDGDVGFTCWSWRD